MNRSDDYLGHAGSALDEPDAAQDDSAAKEMERLQRRMENTRHFYESRMERLAQFAREELAEELQKRFFNIYANGTADWREPHSQTEVDRLRVQVAILTACAEHYANTGRWQRQVIADGYRYQIYQGTGDGWSVAMKALAKVKERER